MKSSSFFKGLSWLIALNLLIKPVWIFLVDRRVQLTSGNQAYGQYFAVLNLSYVLLFLADAGLSNMLNQRIANQRLVNLSQLLRLKLFLLLLFAIACCFTAWLTHLDQWELLFYIILIQALTSFFVFLRNIITAHQFFTTDAWFSVIDKSLMILVCGAIIYTSWFGGINLLLFLQVQCCCTGAAVLLALAFIGYRKLYRGGEKEPVSYILRRILPFAAIILLMSMHYRLDGFLLERMRPDGATEAGIYASAYRLLDAGNMAGYLAASFLVPFIARHQRDRQAINTALLDLRHVLLFFAIGVVCFVGVNASWAERLLYHSSDPYHASVIRFSILALPGYYLVHVYGSALTATARFRPFIIILAISVLVNLVLNLWLIPREGAPGCCFAAIASEYFCGIACWLTASQRLEIRTGYGSALIYLLSAALLCALFYFGRMAISNVWIILAIAAVVTLLLLATQLSTVRKYFISIR